MNNIYFFIMILAAFLAAVSQVMLKMSSKSKKTGMFEYFNPVVLGAYFILLFTMFMNVYAYRGIDYKMGPIIGSSSYVFVMILSHLFLEDKISRNKVKGSVLIIAGILVYNLF